MSNEPQPTPEKHLRSELDRLYKRLLRQQRAVANTQATIRAIDNTLTDPTQLSLLEDA